MNRANNPIEPRIPGAPPWDSAATASGVYCTRNFRNAVDYAIISAEADESIPLVVKIDISDLVIHADPQIIDLLEEPANIYRYDLLNYIRHIYTEKRIALLGQSMPRDEVRKLTGTFEEFAKRCLNDPNFYAPPCQAVYWLSKPSLEYDKQHAAKAILPASYSWMLISIFRKIFGQDSGERLWQYMAWTVSEEDGLYNPNSLICTNLDRKLPEEYYIEASGFFYLKDEVPWSRITQVWSIDEQENKRLWIDNSRVNNIALHGTSLKRFQGAFPEIAFPEISP